MNLLSKITLINLILALVAFSIGGVRVYRNFRYEVQRETDYTLKESYDEIINAMKNGVPPTKLENQLVRITPLPQGARIDSQFVYSDTMAMHPMLKRIEQLRRQTTIREVNGQVYFFDVINVVIEQSDITRITKSLLQDLFTVLGIILLIVNFIVSKWLLRPFEFTLEKIKSFHLRQTEPISFSKTTTTEFRQLNNFLSGMLQKAQNDYYALKEFSENASHEMQTPIAIAAGKLELLLETPGLSDEQMQLVQESRDALSRLSKMGEALLLLTKIENLEFDTPQPVNFSALLQKELTIFSELAEMRGLKITPEIQPDILLPINPSLATILIGNLLKNAIRHNIENGWIKVQLTDQQLIVENTGIAPPVPTEQLFERFRKSSQSGKSLGLGLAIVKKICAVHHWDARYDFNDGVHRLHILFG